MPYFIDLYFPPGLEVDRDEIEEELGELDGIDVVGAGSGEEGSNLDLEISTEVSPDDAVRQVTETLERLGVAAGARMKVSND